ncbi:MAG: hypothetical protein H7A09_03370 [Oceanospirillaceae bacterium]|nr:hypothetical protein [Oceanospirillaceae bacterium]MCP5335656.1 hypothetical protein [Oceanospirillaceae bacterium]MCP5350311.1 hypothetical protein [Oceanospirillaceae bacterium]
MKILLPALIGSLTLSGCLPTSVHEPITPKSDLAAINNLPHIHNQTVEATVAESEIITLGDKLDSDGDVITYTVSASPNYTAGPNENQITYLNKQPGSEVLNIQATDGKSDPVSATLTINVTSENPSNYVISRDVILPNFGSTPPQKGETRTDPTTGAKITRLTDVSELDGTSDALIVYSRYSPENTSGKYFLVFGSNSTSSWVIERETGNIVNKLQKHDAKTVGEYHEVRWDSSGNHPNRIYYRDGMGLYMIDDVSVKNPVATLIKNFAADIPAATIIYNDVEGDSSNDSDHWAFMAAHYNGKTYIVDAFIHYQISTNTTHLMHPADLAGTNLDLEKDNTTFATQRPNMVEMSPLGTGVVIHSGRKWDDSSYGGNGKNYIGTWFDGPHLWPVDFDYTKQSPVKISVGETHSGWAFAEDGREMFISQNNVEDYLDAVYINGENAGYDHRVRVAAHADFGWVGFHYGKVPASKKGWLFISTYSNVSYTDHATKWGVDQLIMMQIKPMKDNPVVWRINPNYNYYAGNYRDEAPAAMNYLGNRIYLTTNWGSASNNREVYVISLPNDWDNPDHF